MFQVNGYAGFGDLYVLFSTSRSAAAVSHILGPDTFD